MKTRYQKSFLRKNKKWSIPIDVFFDSKTRIDESDIYDDNRFVSLREALESEEYKSATAPLSFPLGKDNSGYFFIADYHKLPHIVAGGQTGSGKSSFTEGTLIASLIYRNSPDDLKLILIDPKMVQFSQYEGLPHLQFPVITNPDKSKEAVDWLLAEMERRFDVLSDCQIINIDLYNESGRGHMPYILLIVDEVSDLMMDDRKYYDNAFIRLLQKSRAVGIHLYIGTSRPSPDVLSGMLKANSSTRLAFATSSRLDSRRLIHVNGAEKLLGSGDMLVIVDESFYPIHLQAPYVSEKEQAKLVDFITQKSK